MATETSRSSSSSADSYIGSLISLTSKSEIRYEGILYNINTEESSIGLNNVRSFGTEGRKKDGPQVMPGDKVYDYILFRGSDIKDLQVKSSQPVQPTQSINNDPAIIQSHYPRPPVTLPTSGPTNNLGQLGSTYQSGLPLYQPGGNIGTWAPSQPPPPNTTGPTMPMYWPGYYTPQQNIQTQPLLGPQSLPRPPQGLSMPPSLQYPTFNPPLTTTESQNTHIPNFPEYPSPLLPTSTPFPSSFTGSLPTLMHNKPPITVPPPPGGSLQPPPAVTADVLSGAKFSYQGGPLAPSEPPTPLLVTPGQLLQSVPTTAVPPPVHDDVEKIQVSMTSSSPPPPPPPTSVPVSVPPESQPPILPLPPQTQITPKPNGGNYQNRHNYNYRGRERGKGSGGSRPVVKFTEEFDFNAMNEKFNKDEVWGTLGKSNRSGSKEKDGNVTDEEEESEEENDPNLPKVDVKPVYSKDDFFDSLSSNSLDRQSNYGRTRFSEQMKLDTETFGEFSRYRGGGRGGRGPYRGGRGRGGGGGYYGRGYGYVGRGRGGGRNPNQNPNQNQNQSNQSGDY